MQTPVSKGDTKMQTTALGLSPRASMALAILAALERQDRARHPSEIEIEDISKFLFKLHEARIDIGDVALRRVPGGFYSEDVENLIGHYLASGRAQQMSPVRFTPEGVDFLRKIVDNEKKTNPQAIEIATRVLALNP